MIFGIKSEKINKKCLKIEYGKTLKNPVAMRVFGVRQHKFGKVVDYNQ